MTVAGPDGDEAGSDFEYGTDSAGLGSASVLLCNTRTCPVATR